MSSRRPSVAELERAAARYGSIHERWRSLEGVQAASGDPPPISEAVPRATSLEPAPRTQEGFPPPSEPAFRPAFDTLIGVPRNSFAPADPSKAPEPAAAEPVQALPTLPLPELETPAPRRSFRRLLLAAAVLGAVGVAAAKLGGIERAEGVLAELDARDVMARLGAALSRVTESTAQRIESLRASSSQPPEPDDARARAGTDPSPSTPVQAPAAAQQASEDEPVADATELAAADGIVPRSDTEKGSAARTPTGSNEKQAASKRQSSPRNASKNPASERALPRVTAGAAQSSGGATTGRGVKDGSSKEAAGKDLRRSKPRAPSRKPSRKTGRDGIIRQSPF